MKKIFQKAISCLLTMSLLNVPAFAEEDTEKALLYTAPFVSAEQVSYTCGRLFDDFETGVESWQASDGATLEKGSDAVCGTGCMNVISDGEVQISTTFDKMNITPYSGVMATFGNFTGGSIDIAITVVSGDDEFTAYGDVPTGGYYTLCIDIRKMNGRKNVNGIKIDASSGGFSVDYVNASTTYAPTDAIPNLTREYEINGANAETVSNTLMFDCTGRDVSMQSDRLDRLLKDGENAISVTVNNETDSEAITFAYTDEYGRFRGANSHTETLKKGLCTYTFCLDGVDVIEQFIITFKSKPKGNISVYDISFTYYEEPTERKGSCTVNGENITVSYEELGVPDGYPVYLYRMLPGQKETALPYKSNLQSEKSFTFPVFEDGENNLMYKYKVMYDNDGELKEVCGELYVEDPENCADRGSFVTHSTKKGVYGEYAEFAGAVFLEIDTSAMISDEPTQYAYSIGDKKIFMNGDSVEYLDRRISGINEAGAAPYVVVSIPVSVSEFSNVNFVTSYTSVISFVSQRYNGGENGTVNGFVIGKGLNDSALGIKDALSCAELSLKMAYIAAKSENSSSVVIPSFDGQNGIPVYKFMLSLLPHCPYVSDIMVRCTADGDDSYREIPELLLSLANVGLDREFSLYTVFENYNSEGSLLYDFYSLYVNNNVRSIAVSYGDVLKYPNLFKYMDTKDGTKYTDDFCNGFDITSWSEICPDEAFASNILKTSPAYATYGEIDGGDVMFSSDDIGIWKKGVGCSLLSAENGVVSASFDTNGTGMGFVTFDLPDGLNLRNKTVNVKVKVDYLQTGTESTEVFVYAISPNGRTCSAADVKAETETVISFDSVINADKLMIGIKGSGTPRLTIYEGAVSSDTVTEETDDGEISTDTENVDGEKKNTSTVLKIAIPVCAVVVLSCGAFIFMKKKR